MPQYFSNKLLTNIWNSVNRKERKKERTRNLVDLTMREIVSIFLQVVTNANYYNLAQSRYLQLACAFYFFPLY